VRASYHKEKGGNQADRDGHEVTGGSLLWTQCAGNLSLDTDSKVQMELKLHLNLRILFIFPT